MARFALYFTILQADFTELRIFGIFSIARWSMVPRVGMTWDGPASPHVLLIGMMGAGKTTVGRELSAQTGWPYVDNDDLLRRQTRPRARRDPRDRRRRCPASRRIRRARRGARAWRRRSIIGVAAAAVLDPADPRGAPRRRPRRLASGTPGDTDRADRVRRRPARRMPPIPSGSGSGPASAKRSTRRWPRRSSTPTTNAGRVADEILGGLEGLTPAPRRRRGRQADPGFRRAPRGARASGSGATSARSGDPAGARRRAPRTRGRGRRPGDGRARG